jgi:PAS domain S-box-containing protein
MSRTEHARRGPALPIDFERLFEASPNAYMLLDRDLRYVTANPAYLRITASRLEDLVGRRLFDVFPHDPDDPANENAIQLRSSLTRALVTGRPDVLAYIPYRVPMYREGVAVTEERIWSATHVPIRDAEGEIAYVLQHTVDVSELHRLKRAVASASAQPVPEQVEAGVLSRARDVQATNLELHQERQHLRSLFEQAPGFMCFLRGPEHVVELANAAYDQLVGFRDILGRPVREALPELEKQGFYELLDEVYSTGRRFVGRGMRVLVQRHPGSAPDEVFLDFIYEPITGNEGQVAGIFVQGHDITAQKRLEAELARLLASERAAREQAEAAGESAKLANRLKDEFLATLSHELRTPLNVLLGRARMLQSESIPDDQRRHAAAVIERNARLQLQLVEDILDVSRIITGKLRLRLAPTRLGQIIDAAVEIVRPAAELRGVTLERHVDDSIELAVDADRMQQVVWNLVSNAVKFTPPGGSIDISACRRGPVVRLSVRDTGIGIPPEFLPHVFERFRQGEGTPSRSHGGLGLGLSIVRHLAEAHGGEVTAESGGPGTGSVFTVTLPVGAPAAAEPA